MSKRRVRLDDEAKLNVDTIYGWIAERSPAGANRWYRNFLNALDRLTNDAERYPEAPESHGFDETIRNLTFRMRSGRVYRLLFTISGDEVHVLFVRGPGQDWASR